MEEDSHLQKDTDKINYVCSLVGTHTITEENIKYNCEAEKQANTTIKQIVVNPDLTLQNADGATEGISSNSGDINFREESGMALQNLKDKLK